MTFDVIPYVVKRGGMTCCEGWIVLGQRRAVVRLRQEGRKEPEERTVDALLKKVECESSPDELGSLLLTRER